MLNCLVSYRVATLLTLVVFLLLVNLGFWQLERGEEKQAYEKQLTNRSELPYLLINNLPNSVSVMTGLNVKTNLMASHETLIYLDNQTVEGKVGYLVYQRFTTLESKKSLLVELGFVAATLRRDQLPEVPVRLTPSLIQGRIYTKEANPLSSDLMPEEMQGIRIQNLNFSQLSEHLNVALYPFALQPEKRSDWPLNQPWKPIPMSSSKHFGYAMQWFVMAGVWLVIMLNIVIRRYMKANSRK